MRNNLHALQMLILISTIVITASKCCIASPECTSRMRVLMQPYDVTLILFSGDGKQLICQSDNIGTISTNKQKRAISLSFWDVSNGKINQQVALRSSMTEIVATPSSNTIVSRDDNGYLSTWGLKPWLLRKTLKIGDGAGLAVSADGRNIAVGNGQRLSLYNADKLTLKRRLYGIAGGSLYYIGFSPDGKLVAGVSVSREADEGELVVWETSSGRSICRISEPMGNGKIDGPLTFLPGGRKLAFGNSYLVLNKGSHLGNNHSVRPTHGSSNKAGVYEITSDYGYQIKIKPILAASTRHDRVCIAFHAAEPVMAIVARGDKERTRTALELWDISTGRLERKWIQLFASEPAFASDPQFAFSPSGKLLAGTSGDHQVKIWDRL